MLFDSTEDNLQAAEQGLLVKSLPWLQDDGALHAMISTDDEGAANIHPMTGVTDRYCLSDRFHERNSGERSALLRRVTLVPELNGLINTEVEEQLHSSIGRSNYCLNAMKPSNHLFMMRLKLHHNNSEINDEFKARIEKTFSAQTGYPVQTEVDVMGRLVLRRGNSHFLQKERDSEDTDQTPHGTSSSSAGIQEFSEPEPPLSPIIPVSSAKPTKQTPRPSRTDAGGAEVRVLI